MAANKTHQKILMTLSIDLSEDFFYFFEKFLLLETQCTSVCSDNGVFMSSHRCKGRCNTSLIIHNGLITS